MQPEKLCFLSQAKPKNHVTTKILFHWREIIISREGDIISMEELIILGERDTYFAESSYYFAGGKRYYF